MKDGSLEKILHEYRLVVFVCEGKNEESLLQWMYDEKVLCVKEEYCDFDHMRSSRTKQGKKELLELYRTFDPDGKVAIVYVVDSEQEQWNLKGIDREKFDLIRIVTSPEIEILLTYLNVDIRKAWEKSAKKDSRHPSAFVSEYFCKHGGYSNIKGGNDFKRIIGTINKLRQVAEEHKRCKHKSSDSWYYLYDLFP